MKKQTTFKFITLVVLSFFISITVQAYDISGAVYFDANNDGIFNGNDVDVPAVTVEVYTDVNQDGVPDNGTPLATDVSDRLGAYSLTGINGNVVVTLEESSLGKAAKIRENIKISSGSTSVNLFIIGQYPLCYAFADNGGSGDNDDLVVFNRFNGESIVISSNTNADDDIEAATSNYSASRLYAMDGDILRKYNYSTGAIIESRPAIGNIDYKNSTGTTSSTNVDDVDGIAIAGPNTLWMSETSADGIIFQTDTNGNVVSNLFGSGREGVVVVRPAAISSCDNLDDIVYDPRTEKLYGVVSGCNDNSSKIVEIPTSGGSAGVVTTYYTVQKGSDLWDDVEGLTFSLYGQLMGTTGADATVGARDQHHLTFEIFNGNLQSTVEIQGSPSDYESCDCITRNSDPFSLVTISGTVYNDNNGLNDGVINGTSISSISGSTLYAYLTDAAGVVVQKTTLTSGSYTFEGALTNFAYKVVISTADSTTGTLAPSSGVLPSGYLESGEAYGTNNQVGSGIEPGTPNLSVSVTTGTSNVTGVDFGIMDGNRISGTVWLDEDDGEDIDSDENGRAENVKVYIYSDSNGDQTKDIGSSPIDSVYTDASGFYNYYATYTSGPLSYIIEIDTNTLPEGQSLTTDNKETSSFSSGGNEDTGNDFGYNLSDDYVRITGTVWRDNNENQSIDAGETERASSVLLKVYTDVNSNGSIDGDEPFVFVTATTDANGEYSVELPYDGAVQYIVEVAQSDLPGDLTTSETVVANFGVNAGGTTITDLDFGYNAATDKKYISGTVFVDVNEDTTYNSGDVGDPGVTVYLYQDDDGDGIIDASESTPVDSTTTNNQGFYDFEVDDECQTISHPNRRVNSSSDDANQKLDDGNKMELNKDQLKMGEQGKDLNGVIFRNINITQGANITSAYVQFTGNKDGQNSGTVTISGFLQDDAPTFTSSTSNISNRASTSATVNWSVNKDNWEKDDATTDERTPDISAIIQEILGQSTWSSGEALGLKFESSNVKVEAKTYDKSTSQAPMLVMTYEANCNENFIIKIKESDLPVGYVYSTDDIERAVNMTPGTTDIGNDFGYLFENLTVATDDDNSTFVNIAVGGNVKTNDFDPESDVQTFKSFLNQDGSGSLFTSGGTVSGVDVAGNPVANAGTLTFTAVGKYLYRPANGFVGEVEIPYYICDDGFPRACDTALLVIEVEREIDPTDPNFNNIYANDDDAYTYGETITAFALSNDGDPEQDSFYLTSFKYDNNGDGNPTVSGTLNSQITVGGVSNEGGAVANAGTFEIDKHGEYTFTPSNGFEGNVTIEYEICDTVSGANKACEVANINIIVYESNGAANDPPFAGDDFAYTTKNQPVIANWIQNDYDVNSDDININQEPTNFDKSNLASDTSGGAISTVATDSGGVVRFYANGTYKYTPPRGHTGTDQVKYLICDNTTTQPQPLCDSATMYFVISNLVRDYGDLPLTSGVAWNVFKDVDNNGIPEGETPIWLGEFVSDDDSTLYNATATGDSDDGLMMPAQLDSTKDNTFRVIVNSTKSNVTVYFTLYFDWDKDGSFEASYSGSGLTGSPDTVDVDVAYPGGDGSFNSRLRVSLDPNDIQPTGQMMNGETEDYVGNLTPVPVELLYFSARAEGEVSLLEWETASELNNSHFEIERKTPRSDWEYIGREDGHGATQSIQSYSHIDYNPYPGVNYYRLRQVDFDGAYEYSNVEAVEFGLIQKIEAYPNPTHDYVTVHIDEVKENVKIELLNAIGQPLQSIPVDQNRGDISLKIDVSEYSSGIYYIQVTQSDSQQTIKLILD